MYSASYITSTFLNCNPRVKKIFFKIIEERRALKHISAIEIILFAGMWKIQ